MRFLPLTLFACLPWLSSVSGHTAPSQATPAWNAIESTPGHLAFVGSLSTYALNAPVTDLPAAFESIARWPEQTEPEPHSARPLIFPADRFAPRRERINRASEVIAYAYTARATSAAVAYHDSLTARSATDDAVNRFRPGFFAALTTLNPDLARAELLKLSDGSERQIPTLVILRKLAPADPEKAFSLLIELNVTDPTTVTETLLALARLTPERALAALAQIPADLRPHAERQLLAAWFRASPALAAGWVTAHIPEGRRATVLNQVFGFLTLRGFDRLLVLETDPDPIVRTAATRMIDFAINHQPLPVIFNRIQTAGWKGLHFAESHRDIMGTSLSTVLAFASVQPPEEIKALFRSLPPDKFKNPDNVIAIVSLWSLHDPEAALAWAEKIPGPILRNTALVRINSLLTETDVQLAFDQIAATPPGPFRNELIEATSTALSKKNLQQGIDWAFSLPPGPEQTTSLETLARSGATHDPTTLVTALTRLPADRISSDALCTFGTQWLQTDTASALDWFIQLPSGPVRQRLSDLAADMVSRHDPDRAFALAHTLPVGAERSQLIQYLAEKQAITRLDDVLALIDDLPPGRNRQFARDALLRAITADDPLVAVSHLNAGTFGPIRPSAIEKIAYTWSQQSPAESAAWLTTQLKPRDNDMQLIFGGVGPVARNYAKESPDAAIAWASSLTDPVATRRAQSAVIEQIAKTNPIRARRLIETSTLPETDKSRLLDTALHP